MPHSVWTHTSRLYSRNERSINIPAAGDSSRENWGPLLLPYGVENPSVRVQLRIVCSNMQRHRSIQRTDMISRWVLVFLSRQHNTQYTAPSQTTDEKDTAPSRRAHTPPLWRSPQDTRAFPAVPHIDPVPRSYWRYYPDGWRPQTNVMTQLLLD